MDSLLYLLAGIAVGMIFMGYLFARKRPPDPFQGVDLEIMARARERAKRERN